MEEPHKEITLRPMELTDVDEFLTWATDDRVTHFTRFDTFTSRDQAIEYMKIPHPWLRAICVENRAIGMIFVIPIPNEGKRRAEMGYLLGLRHWGKGIGTKAVKMVASTIFKEWSELERLEAAVDVRNKGSQKVLEKAGFEKEGVLKKYMKLNGKARDMFMFSLVSHDHDHDQDQDLPII
ncbi:uncharacterized N-acetyltransferase p20-like [Impatiens glandulifera]|uniref:uncharacterized N-acetyltransferase p20-like n=1 Tax=Impatiens glandulifera TaxID=253017 RepID=UPI001FB067C7|nr:uncharacterized N-acetyltransferase p20-like [Impatiens glandulifera]